MTYLKRMQQIVSDYRAAKRPWPATAREIAEWAISEGKWDMPPAAVTKKCSEDIAEAMREFYFTDKQGRRVRALHPAAIRRQGVLFTEWDDLRTASRKHVKSLPTVTPFSRPIPTPLGGEEWAYPRSA